MKSEVDEKGKGNLGQERGNSFAMATLSQQQQSSSALCLSLVPYLHKRRKMGAAAGEHH